MDDGLFTIADFSDFDYARARSDRGGKDTFLRIRLRGGNLHPDRAQYERNWIWRGCLSERDSRARHHHCFNSNVEPDGHRLQWRRRECCVWRWWDGHRTVSFNSHLFAHNIKFGRDKHVHHHFDAERSDRRVERNAGK